MSFDYISDYTPLHSSSDQTSMSSKGKGVASSLQFDPKCKIFWDGQYSPRTARLIAWLKDNPNDRLKLFSDSTQDAIAEGRKKRVGKESKMVYCTKIAHAVFGSDKDPVMRTHYQDHLEKFARAVDSRLGT